MHIDIIVDKAMWGKVKNLEFPNCLQLQFGNKKPICF